MGIIVVIKLVAAHFVGDFILQWDSFCKKKENIQSWLGWGAQAVHALIHGALAYLFVAEWSCWTVPVIISGSHFLIDVIKAKFDKGNTFVFLVDQALHIAIITLCYLCLFNGELCSVDFSLPKIWMIALSYILLLKPTSVFVGIFCNRFERKQDGKSLLQGGRYIGYLERILILTFVFSGWMEGIGYLLAAKSVFRFGDLKNNTELKHTEYVLVGTLLSFSIAVLVGVVARYVFNINF